MSNLEYGGVTTDLSVCVDCLYLLANGEPESVDTWHCQDAFDSDSAKAIAAFCEAAEGSWEGFSVSLGSATCEHCTDEEEDCEPWFSHSRCDMCGNPRGGSRVHATAMPETYAALVGATDWRSEEVKSAETIEREVMRTVLGLDHALREAVRDQRHYERLAETFEDTLLAIAEDIRAHVRTPETWDASETLRDIAGRLNDLPDIDSFGPDAIPKGPLTELTPAGAAFYAYTGRMP